MSSASSTPTENAHRGGSGTPPADSPIDKLQSEHSRQILDCVDELRRVGLQKELQLPQIVVCGDQSAGKSSVLEALTEIPFPHTEGLCTRFATEIQLHRGPHEHATAYIIPDSKCPPARKQALESFKRTMSSSEELGPLIEIAKSEMGLENTKQLSRNVLRLEICGPKQPQLTLVDLPGLIHVQSNKESATDSDGTAVALTHQLVEEYIKNPRAIVLAVVSAKNDFANQIILEKCQKEDRPSRTFGIITKPDSFKLQSSQEKDWMELARNQTFKLGLGWHLVMNDPVAQAHSFERRNQYEEKFFTGRGYGSEVGCGIKKLRSRLSMILNDLLKREIPALDKDLDPKMEEINQTLSRLGSSRPDTSHKRRYLIDVGAAVASSIQDVVDGNYSNPIFRKVESLQKTNSSKRKLHLRAAVKSLNLDFAQYMNEKGKKWDLQGSPSNDPDMFAPANVRDVLVDFQNKKRSAESDELIGMPLPIGHQNAVSQTVTLMQKSCGQELPGTFNARHIKQLFAHQSELWKPIAESHVDRVANLCKIFVVILLKGIAHQQTVRRIVHHHVKDTLNDMHQAAISELQRILTDEQSHPITYNRSYQEGIKESRKRAHRDMNPSGTQDPDLQRLAAKDALKCMEQYYETTLDYFVDSVAKQVIERHLIRDLPERIFTAHMVGGYTDEEISLLAMEDESAASQRTKLEREKAALSNAQEIFGKVKASLDIDDFVIDGVDG
ncbi:MAG: hypothetical protein M1831_001396 [Alyxoria varia]|nr:MAG: hypothetical protein M1831_001396 [Alyxoria varia]